MAKQAKVERAAEWVAPQALIAWSGNPRRNAKAIGEVKKSIKRFGFGAPIVARAANREVIAGHTRLAAALSMGLAKVPVRYLDISEQDAHRLALADNKTGEVAEWSDDLDALLAQLGTDLPGFDDSLSALEALLDPPPSASADPPVIEPAADTPFVSEAGRVYQLGRHTLTFGSSLGVVDPDAAGLIFDPPFDADYSAWQVPPKAVVVVVWRRCDSAFGWIADRIEDGFGTHELVFTGGVRGQHNHTLPACMHENVTVLRRKWWADKFDALDRATLKMSGAKVTKDGRHISWQEHSGGVVAAQSIGMSWAKPIMQMMIAMAYMPKAAIVFDPCAGSGSSLLAAERSGRTCHAFETQGAWVDLIRRRWTRECTERRVDPGPDSLT